MVTIYNTTLSATSQRHFSDGLGGECFANVQLFSEIYAKNLEKSLVISNFGCLCLSKKE